MDQLNNPFKLTLEIKKAYHKTSEDGQITRFIAGRASGVNLDLEGERMAETAILAFQKTIHEGIYTHNGEWSLIPLLSGHQDEWEYQIGYLVDATVDSNWDLWIEAELEEGNPKAELLYRRLTTPAKNGRPKQLGLSVGGKVISSGQEWNELTQSYNRVFHEVALDEISITTRPALPTAYVYALAKSLGDKQHSSDSDEAQVLEKTLPNDDNTEDVMSDLNKTDDAADEQDLTKHTDEQVIADDVTKSDELANTNDGDNSEVTKTEPKGLAELQTVVDGLSKKFDDLATALTAIVAKSVEAPANTESKAEEEVAKSTDLAKSDDAEAVDKSVASLSVEVLGQTIGAVVAKALEPYANRLTELESMPVDKSLAVDEAPNQQNETPMQRFEREAETAVGADILKVALQAAGV